MHILMNKKNWRGKEEQETSSRIQVPGNRVQAKEQVTGYRVQVTREKEGGRG